MRGIFGLILFLGLGVFLTWYFIGEAVDSFDHEKIREEARTKWLQGEDHEFIPYWEKWLKHWDAIWTPPVPSIEDMDDEEEYVYLEAYVPSTIIMGLCREKDKLQTCLAPLPRAEALTKRIFEIIDVAIPDPESAELVMGMFFGVPRPYPASDGELTKWATLYLAQVAKLSGMSGGTSSVRIERCDNPSARVERGQCGVELDAMQFGLKMWMDKRVRSDCTTEEQAAYKLMEEPLYDMAYDLGLAGYVQSVFLEDKLSGPNPFRARFDLWRCDAHLCLEAPDKLAVYAPNTAADSD